MHLAHQERGSSIGRLAFLHSVSPVCHAKVIARILTGQVVASVVYHCREEVVERLDHTFFL